MYNELYLYNEQVSYDYELSKLNKISEKFY